MDNPDCGHDPGMQLSRQADDAEMQLSLTNIVHVLNHLAGTTNRKASTNQINNWIVKLSTFQHDQSVLTTDSPCHYTEGIDENKPNGGSVQIIDARGRIEEFPAR